MARIKEGGKTVDFSMEKEYRVDGVHFQTKEKVTFILLKQGTRLDKDDSDIETYTNTTTGCTTTGIWVKGYYDWGGHDGEGNWIIPTDFFLRNVTESGTICTGENGIPAGGAGTSKKTDSATLQRLYGLDEVKNGGRTIELSKRKQEIEAEEELKFSKKKTEADEAGIGFMGWVAILGGAGLMYKYVLSK